MAADQPRALSGPRPGETERLPLFPLGVVLMPGCVLPLHVFEPRYRRLLQDVTVSGGTGRFGIVWLVAGTEVGSDDAAVRLAQVGTAAQVLEVHPDPDGTFDVLTGGTVRFHIDRMVDGVEPYLQADVTYLREVDGDVSQALVEGTLAIAGEYADLVRRLSGAGTTRPEPYPEDRAMLSYRLALEAPLAPSDHQRMLEDTTAADRFARVRRVLRREVLLMRRTRSIPVPAGFFIPQRHPN